MLIALSGHRGVGKTSAATYMKNNYGFYIRSFAQPMRRIGTEIFDFSEKDFLPENKEKPYKHYDWTPRDFLDNLGKFIRYHDNDYLVNELLKSLEASTQNYVVDDLRKLEELKALKMVNSKIIRINRYEKLNVYKSPPSDLDKELDNEKFDYVIEDCYNVSMTDLRKQIDHVMGMYGIKRR